MLTSTHAAPAARDERARAAPSPSLSIVICTMDRPDELAACLASIGRQSVLPHEIVIVDAGRSPAAVTGELPADCPVHLHRTTPGLTRQRNLGVAQAQGEVILFLDDDVVLEPDYLAAILAVYTSDPAGRIGGVGGAIVPDPTPVESWGKRFLGRIFLLPGYGAGRIKRSGYPEYALSPQAPLRVEFLSGCNMSFRREVFQTLEFDERLAGYALGEDLTFSYGVSRRWTLALTPNARLDHRESGGGRPLDGRRREMAVFNHYLFFREQVGQGRARWAFYLWAALGQLIVTLRHPGDGRLWGLLRGYGRVVSDLPHSRTRTAERDAVSPSSEAWQPLVSVIVPARNEEHFLARCLDSILMQRYPAERVEVIVVENGSTDRTRDVAHACAIASSRVRVLETDAANQADAMNAGVAVANGELVARVDAHSFIDRDYLRLAVAALHRHPTAACVGGPFLAIGESLMERVTGLARSSRVGVGGGYGADRSAEEHPVATVQCGVYRREALLATGGFDVAMAYGEDEELNWRLGKRGERIVLVPALHQYYRPRRSLRALARQYWNYGQGRLRVVLKHPDFLRLRHLAPSGFVAALVLLTCVAPFSTWGRTALAWLLGLYALALVAALLGAAPRDRRAAPLVPIAIATIHLAYGAGMLVGLARHLRGRFVSTKQAEDKAWQGTLGQPHGR